MESPKKEVYNNYVNSCKTPLGKSDYAVNLHNGNGSRGPDQGMYVTEYTRAYTWPIQTRGTVHCVPHTNTPYLNGICNNGDGTFAKKVRDNGNWSRLEEVVDGLMNLGLKGHDLKLVKKAVHSRRLDAAIECAARYITEKKSLLLKKKAKSATASTRRSRLFKLCNEFGDTVRKLKKN